MVVGSPGWILEAIARQWNDIFSNYTSSEVVIGQTKNGSNIYIHFFYGDCKIVENAINVVYVTHISSYLNSLMLLLQYSKDCIFITMSNETCKQVKKICGKKAIVYSHLPESIHFNKIVINKSLSFGYFSKRHNDGRKNEQLLINISKIINNSNNASLLIFGSGWSNLSLLNGPNVFIDDSEFDKNNYLNNLKKCDFVINTSNDEGAISILDAATLNIPVIATGVGYHSEIIHARGALICQNYQEILSVISNLVITNELGIGYYNSISDIANILLNLKKETSNNKIGLKFFNIFRIKYVYNINKNVLFTIRYLLKKLFF